MKDEEWYSDAALAKQKALREKKGPPTWSDLRGLLEPRTQPADNEKCERCGSDARDYVGGEVVNGRLLCGIHAGREQ